MTNRIADLRLEQFEVNQQRDALFQSDAFVAKLEEGHCSDVNPMKCTPRCWRSIDMRRELLGSAQQTAGQPADDGHQPADQPAAADERLEQV